jgi:hypothetical protein
MPLARGCAEITLAGVMAEVPPLGTVDGTSESASVRRDCVRSGEYEITFAGEAGTALRAEFDDCEVVVGGGTTTLRVDLPDQGALLGLLLRIASLRLDVVQVLLVSPPPGP